MKTIRNFLLLLVLLSVSVVLSAQKKGVIYVLFDVDKYEIKTDYKQLIDSLLNVIKDKNYNISLIGRADSTGNIEANLKLSQNRVNSVARYLSENGVGFDKITMNYFGENKPLISENQVIEMEKNRSVLIKVSLDENSRTRDTLTAHQRFLQFENDSLIYTKGGAQILVKAGTFFPTKISEIDFHISEVYSVCDILYNNSSLTTDDGNCLTSAGMIYIKPMLDTVEIQPNGGSKVTVRIPIMEGNEFDKDMKIYVEKEKANGKKVWKLIEAEMTCERGGELFYSFEVEEFGGINIDKPLGVLCQKEGPKIKIPRFKSADVCQTYPEEIYLSRGEQIKTKVFQIDEVVIDKNPYINVVAYNKKGRAFVAEGDLLKLTHRKASDTYVVKARYFKKLKPEESEYVTPEDILCREMN